MQRASGSRHLFAHLVRELLEQLPLLLCDLLGDDDVHVDVHTAADVALQARHAEALYANDLLVLATRGDTDLHLLVGHNAVNLDFGTEDRLDEGYVRAPVQIVTVAFEELVRLHAASDDKVARLCALDACFAEAAHAQLLAVADACGHLHRDALAVGHAALAFAFGAGVLDRRAGAVALLAGRGRLHVTQKRTLNADDAALAAAFGAGDYLAVLAEARPLAIGAGCEAVVDDFLLDAACDLFKRDT